MRWGDITGGGEHESTIHDCRRSGFCIRDKLVTPERSEARETDAEVGDSAFESFSADLALIKS